MHKEMPNHKTSQSVMCTLRHLILLNCKCSSHLKKESRISHQAVLFNGQKHSSAKQIPQLTFQSGYSWPFSPSFNPFSIRMHVYIWCFVSWDFLTHEPSPSGKARAMSQFMQMHHYLWLSFCKHEFEMRGEKGHISLAYSVLKKKKAQMSSSTCQTCTM